MLRRPWWTAIALVVLFAFCPALHDEMTFDDIPLVKDLQVPATFGLWIEAPLQSWWPPEHHKTLWRPVTRMGILAQKLLFRSFTPPYYAVNMLLYTAVCLLLFETARRLGLNEWAAGAGALVFAAHALHCEVVHQIVGQAEIWAALWMLVGLFLYLKHGLRNARVLWQQPLCYALALGGKEHAILYPLFLFLITMSKPVIHKSSGRWRSSAHWSHCIWPRRENFWRLMILMALVGVLFVICKMFVAGGAIEPSSTVPEYENILARWSFSRRLPAVLGIFGYAVTRVIWPLRLSPDYSVLSFPFERGWDWNWAPIGAALLVLLIVWIVFDAWRGGRGWALGIAGLAAYCLTSNFLFVIGTVTAERLWFWPSAMACIGLGWAIGRYRRWLGPGGRRSATLILAMLVICMLAATWHYSPSWRSPFDHAERTRERFPRSWRGNVNLANAYFDLGLSDTQYFDKGLSCAQEAVEILPNQALGYYWVGMNATFAAGKLKEAEEAFRKALALDPSLSRAHTRLSVVLEIMQRDKEALAEVEKVYPPAGPPPTDEKIRIRIEKLRARVAQEEHANKPATTPTPKP